MKIQIQVIGTVHLVENEQTFSSGFTKQVMVVTTEDQYPQTLAIEFLKDKTALLGKIRRGDRVDVTCDVRGSEYKGRYYVNLVGWKIEKLGSVNYDTHEESVPPPEDNPDDEDLPEVPF